MMCVSLLEKNTFKHRPSKGSGRCEFTGSCYLGKAAVSVARQTHPAAQRKSVNKHLHTRHGGGGEGGRGLPPSALVWRFTTVPNASHSAQTPSYSVGKGGLSDKTRQDGHIF